MDNKCREDIIKKMYSEIVKDLPEADEERSYFDEGTGTWYALTGRSQIDRLNVEKAKDYFEGAIKRFCKAQPGTNEFQKALYCAIAVEAIAQYLGNKQNKVKEKRKEK